MVIPCKECPVLAICKHKSFYELSKCDILRDMIYDVKVEDNHIFSRRKHHFYRLLLEVEKFMQPPNWKVSINDIKVKKVKELYYGDSM